MDQEKEIINLQQEVELLKIDIASLRDLVKCHEMLLQSHQKLIEKITNRLMNP